jgi:hypothetical protein
LENGLTQANSLDDDVNDDDEVLGVCEKKSFSARGRRMVLSTIQQREQLHHRGGHFKNFADAALKAKEAVARRRRRTTTTKI